MLAASVSGSQSVDQNSSNDAAIASTTVKGVTDLSITNADSPDPLDVGKQITYAVMKVNE